MITNFSVSGFCDDMQPSLNSSSPTSRSRVVAIICRLSHIPRLSVSNTGTLRSSIRIASPHPNRPAVACHTTGTPDDKADIRCCHCCLPASHPAQATTMKMTRDTEEERQRQPRKVLHMSASVNIPAQCKNNKPKKLRMRPLGAAPPYATDYLAA